MEKRSHRSSHHADRWQRCRAVLQRGLSLNPTSSCLVQVRVCVPVRVRVCMH